jgi:hypothetical protein
MKTKRVIPGMRVLHHHFWMDPKTMDRRVEENALMLHTSPNAIPRSTMHPAPSA